MPEKKDKKQTLLLIISCALCLALGLALGYGIRTQNLTGTAAFVPPIPQAAGTQAQTGSMDTALLKHYTNLQASYHEQITELTNTIGEACKTAEDDGEISEAENAALAELMRKLQALTDRYNGVSASITYLLSITAQMHDSMAKGQ